MMKIVSNRIYYSLFSLLAVIGFAGLVVAAYLCLTHYWIYTDLTYSSFCAISRALNCDTVAQSPWSILWGIPVSYYGVLGYLIFLLLLSPLAKQKPQKQHLWVLLVILGGLYTLISLYFSYISSTKIHSYCILCLTCFAINFFLFLFSMLGYRQLGRGSFRKDFITSIHYILGNKLVISILISILLLFGISQFFLPKYWILENPPDNTELQTGFTSAGHPWIGAVNPRETIEEFSDYQCFQCSKAHWMLRNLVAQHPDTLRLVHRHYPLDHEFNPTIVTDPFHIGSGKMSLLAIYAASKNKFWEMNDALFEIGRKKESFDTEDLAEITGIPSGELSAALSHPAVREQLNRDIRSGMKLRIIATPTFVINGEAYTGSIPPGVLNSILERAEQSETRK